MERQTYECIETSRQFVDEIAVVFWKRLGDVDEQFKFPTEDMVRLPSPEGKLECFEVSSFFEGTLHPSRLGDVDLQQRDAMCLGVLLSNFLRHFTTKRRPMQCRRFASKLSSITAYYLPTSLIF